MTDPDLRSYVPGDREARLARIGADSSVREVALVTSQHTRGFYERMGFVCERVVADGFAPELHRCEMRMRTGVEGRRP